ncbi:MAG: Leader peptidase (Prepilin peptidase) (EC / N-methyltransferase (EC [uncultured Sulfurovum sp.]|uniref:Leader peptidase (Prepilin peptidase) ) n=1 Tax=uncultured Sulfurovum sp. TaxID=269237 RepID=A0A6S6SG47_9BACT|nr:MAG: Leader peptidase (Prepilin peptidase) (EC / N-methyltransferase (EC [uncultured Sulfurovum sp.]
MELLIIFFVFIFGIMIGSFLNVVIYRVPKDESIVFPASKCQSCQTALKWYHNIPLFSWLFLGGKCAFCKEEISKQYPVVELLTGLLFVALFMKLGLVWYLPFVAASFAALLALVMIDFKYMAVPDSINFAALLFAVIQPNFIDAALYALIAAGGLYMVGLLSSFLARRQAMGGADVIVAGTMGALLGFPNFFVAIFLSAILAMLPAMIWREKGVPFVPFLALATFIVYLYSTEATELLEKIIYG